MLWNWNTVDACFLSASWQIRSAATFALLCIGVIMLVVLFEALRRAGREYDRYIIRARVAGQITHSVSPSNGPSDVRSNKEPVPAPDGAGPASAGEQSSSAAPFRPSVAQPSGERHCYARYSLPPHISSCCKFSRLAPRSGLGVRCVLSRGSLAMYFNGYVIICIFIGAYLGSYVFEWEVLTPVPMVPPGSAGRGGNWLLWLRSS